MADLLRRALSDHMEPEIVAKFREGDTTHCIGDICQARHLLAYIPRVSLDQGIGDLVNWSWALRPKDRIARACADVKARGLVR